MKVGTWGGGIGAFYATKEIFQAAHVDEDVPLVKFDASRVSQIYSEVSTVQPRAIQTLIIIKVWKAGGCRVSPEYIELDFFRENENQTPFVL